MELHACETDPERSPQPTAGLVVGVVDAQWIVQQISVDGHGTLGSSAAEVVGASLLHHVHPGDISDLRTAAQTATTVGTGSALVVKVGGPGSWSPVRIIVTPMVGGELGFAITGSPREDSHQQRTTLLEQHLWRIAREIEAAGIGLVPDGHTDLASLSGVEELSPRQWEVLQRLLRGERVPGIARALFLSPSTVRNHLTSIFAKVGVHSQEELIQRIRSTSRASVPA